jgi:hypothetical protein
VSNHSIVEERSKMQIPKLVAIIIGILVCSPAVRQNSCSPYDWRAVQQDLLWTTELDADARQCVRGKVINEGKTTYDAIVDCNPGLGDKAPLNEQSKRYFRCGFYTCNWLKARKWDPAC